MLAPALSNLREKVVADRVSVNPATDTGTARTRRRWACLLKSSRDFIISFLVLARANEIAISR